MNLEIRNLFSEIEIVKEKINDAVTSFGWFEDEYFIHEPSHVLSMNEVKLHGYKYHEHRIQIAQLHDLMRMYTKQLDEKIQEFKEIEKASSAKFGDRTDNA
ncbi:DUF1474 family protein [Staphylococcus pseudintermedius]|nr:DUF1474 family protein [Staphylococcus pseudintermedius]EGQ4036486.1 DUF1474 family protein [Staphylococcus pseudintermedius]EGQ4064328.1 DUF1474 family protein [Staphylococcus pseudintermedius]EJG1261328.1 DUF1474 family protein [Staphylococcus pseudintermedius]HAR5767756.1 DUF1474 family protein [Staphylococcus pseudintermedius]